jgi:hypothetical protein
MRVDDEWRSVEAASLHAGTLLPLSHRSAWAKEQPEGSVFLASVPLIDASATSVVVQRDRSRVLPGHTFLRVSRFGHGWTVQEWDASLRGLKEIAGAESKVLRLSIEIFLRRDREKMQQILTNLGFQPVALRSYRHTLTLAVDQPDEELLSNRKTLKKRLREVEKAGAVLRVLTEERYAATLAALQQQAMKRSGGSFRIPDWPAVLRLSAENPHLSRVVGLFLSPDSVGPEDLLGFAWGCMNGDHAEYRAGAATDTQRKLSISYPLVWNLIQWTRDSGGSWFDMGGVTLQEGAEDPLAGISAMKRVFSETVEEVGEEWALEPHVWKSQLARGLGGLIAKASALTKARAGERG